MSSRQDFPPLALATCGILLVLAGLAGYRSPAAIEVARHGGVWEIAVRRGWLCVDNDPQVLLEEAFARYRRQSVERLASRFDEDEAVMRMSRGSDRFNRTGGDALVLEIVGSAAQLKAWRAVATPVRARRLYSFPLLDTGLALFAAAVITVAYGYGLRQFRMRRNRCRNCGFDLRASAHRCPECGYAMPIKVPATRRSSVATDSVGARRTVVMPPVRRLVRLALVILTPPHRSATGQLLYVCGIALYFQASAAAIEVLASLAATTAGRVTRDLLWSMALFLLGTIVLSAVRWACSLR